MKENVNIKLLSTTYRYELKLRDIYGNFHIAKIETSEMLPPKMNSKEFVDFAVEYSSGVRLQVTSRFTKSEVRLIFLHDNDKAMWLSIDFYLKSANPEDKQMLKNLNESMNGQKSSGDKRVIHMFLKNFLIF